MTRALLFRAGLVESPVPVIGRYASDHDPLAYVEAWEVSEALILRLKRVAENDGTRFGVIIVPDFYQVFPNLLAEQFGNFPDLLTHYDLDKPDRRLMAFLDSNQIPYLQLLPHFREYNVEEHETLYVSGDWHWSEQGNRFVADLISDWIVAENLHDSSP